jgi:dienelactone hydrolase
MQWNLEHLMTTPAAGKAEAFDYQQDVQPVFYDCGTWKNRSVKAFAWIGFPKMREGEKCPGIVLVHGGGGTAFPDWVRLWNARGYAAIAMDTCGGVPCWHETPHGRPQWPRHAFSGPAGWGMFPEASLPPEEQWPYQAVATVIAGHSLLRSFPQVDAGRIGITGVSWGGVLACMAAGLDPRLAFAAPVYGCGFLNLSCLWNPEDVQQHSGACEAWLRLWDPALYLRTAKSPFLWLTGTNDAAFPFDTTFRSAQITAGKSSFALIVRMPHGHGGPGEKPEEIHNFANAVTGHGMFLPPPEMAPPRINNGKVMAGFAVAAGGENFDRAELIYTTGSGAYKERLWQQQPAEITPAAGSLQADIPAEMTVLYFNLFSKSGLTFSSSPLFKERR